MSLQLGVNIDHVATLRHARQETYPDPLMAAEICLAMGADYIVIHVRNDDRHMTEKDLARLCKVYRKYIHLECNFSEKMQKMVLKYKPGSVCIVPEQPGEVTTTGGLKFTPKNFDRIRAMTEALQKKKIRVSLFIDPTADSVRTAAKCGADIVELCTRDYSQARTAKQRAALLQDLAMSSLLAKELGLEVHAGHGLDYENVLPVADLCGMSCLNIGFSIISRAVLAGLPNAVSGMKELL
ncbi:MAG: pyridoxine 5'-phosphate synthase [Elusimicrobiaceae bacterium]|nr:pyridoxine 5'-phosphate synthase [Elusimicrobiaceae bacterium]